MELILKVAHSGRKTNDLNTTYYLRVNTADKNLFSRERPVTFILDQFIKFEVSLGQAYDNANFITNPNINEWIRKNKFDVFPKGQPTKLKFLKSNDILSFVSKL